MRNQAVSVEVQVFCHVLLKRGGGLLTFTMSFLRECVSVSFVNFALAQKRFQKQSYLKDI